MSLVYHERPGVYSSYDASSIIARGSTERVIALIGKAEAKAGLYRLHSYAEAKEAFAEGSELGRMAKLAYQNGAGTVLASPVAEDTLEAYQAALALVFAEKEAGFCVVGSALETVQKALRDAVESASKQNCGSGRADTQESDGPGGGSELRAYGARCAGCVCLGREHACRRSDGSCGAGRRADRSVGPGAAAQRTGSVWHNRREQDV